MGDKCSYIHATGDTFMSIKKQWIDERVQSRRTHSVIEGDPFDIHDKANKTHRAEIFAKWLVDTFTQPRLNAGAGVTLITALFKYIHIQ